MNSNTGIPHQGANKYDKQEVARSVSIGERALSYIKQFGATAVPRNYEIFYLHSSGQNKALSDAIRKAVADHSCLTEADADKLYENYVKPEAVADQVEKVGGQMFGEIKELLAAVTKASQKTGVFGESLKGITNELNSVDTPSQLNIVIKKLVVSTNEMSDYSRDLETRLADSKKQIEDLHHTLETIRAESLTDELTGLSNRKRFDQVLEMEIVEAEGSAEPLCLLLLDIDHFKSFNDTFGHQTGDQVLRLFAHTLKANVKGRDHASRYGGEEFAVILPKTPLRAAVALANQIREAVRSKELIKKSTGQSLGRITISVGAAAYKTGETEESLIKRADKCLYAAKEAGRNRVKCDTDPDVDKATAAA